MSKNKSKVEEIVKSEFECVLVNQNKSDFHLTLGSIKVGKKDYDNVIILNPKARVKFTFKKDELENVKKQIKSKNIVIKIKE